MRSRFAAPVALTLALLHAPCAFARPGGAALDLPGAGPVVDVGRTQFRDGFAQRVVFQGDPRNVADISIRTRSAGAALGPAITLAKPSRAGIMTELRARFPGETMRVVTQPRRNAYGPVGMALGQDCLYAWQWIDFGGGLGSSPFGGDGAAASVRIKLCRTGTASLADLAGAVERMRISADAGGVPAYVGAGPPSGGTRTRPEPAPQRPAARAAAKPADRAAKALGAKATGAKATGTSAPGAMERPRAARQPEPAPPREAQRAIGPGATPPMPAAVPVASGQGERPRYITDGAPGAGNPAIAAPKPAPNRAEIEDLLARELPARAYRPPP